jgi:hypothetical protein
VETLALVRVPASAPCEAIGAQSQVGRRRLRRRRYH